MFNGNPYFQPNFNQQMINPFNQYQQMIQNQQNTLSGKVVDNFDYITANDVPMDGRFSTFVKSDLSEIEVRQWNANGTIGKMTFKPIPDSVNKEQGQDNTTLIREMLTAFNERFDLLEKQIEKLKPSTRTRKDE